MHSTHARTNRAQCAHPEYSLLAFAQHFHGRILRFHTKIGGVLSANVTRRKIGKFSFSAEMENSLGVN